MNSSGSISPGHESDELSFAGAVLSGDLEKVRDLLEKGADINTVFYTPESYYTDKTNPSFKSEYACTGLHLALMRQNAEMAGYFIDKGADPDIKNGWDQSNALLLSLLNHLPQIAERLIKAGAAVNEKNKWGDDAFFLAVQKGYSDVVKLLLQKGAVPAAGDSRGDAMLYYASERGYFTVAEMLVKKGVNVNANITDGYTALYAAVSHGHTDMVRLLIKSGADVKLSYKWNETALSVAVEKGFLEIAQLLKKAGAEK